MNRILITRTSFLDTPGRHHDLINELKWEIAEARGPLSEADTLAVANEIDGYTCGDDAITRHVIGRGYGSDVLDHQPPQTTRC